MASTTLDRPVRLIRVQPNPVFQEPKHLPIKPLTQAPIEIERPADYLTSCIHRGDFKDIHPDLLKAYTKHYDIKIDHEKVLRAEIMAVLCMKNEWIPILPEHNATTHTEAEHVPLSTTEGDGEAPTVVPNAEVEAYIPDRFRTPEDSYDNDAGPSTAVDPSSKNSDGNVIEEIDFDTLPSTISLGDLANLTSCLQARHTQIQCALTDATAATREAAANVLEMMARLENEKARMRKIMETVSEIVGEYDEKIEPNEGSDEEVEEVESNIVSEKRKGKERAIRSSARTSLGREQHLPALRPSPLCPNCRVARDLTVSQRHSVYLCAEHMPNPYKTNGTPNEGSHVPISASGSSSSRNDKRRPLDLSSSRESTIIFGLTTKPVPTSNPPSKGKKRSLEGNEAGEGPHSTSISSNQSPKRARVEGSRDITQSRNFHQDSSPSLGPIPESKKSAFQRGANGFSTISISDAEEFAGVEEEATVLERGAPLRRTFTINDFDDPEEVANVERMEASSSSMPRRQPSTMTGNPLVATPSRRVPLRRTFSITNLGDADELANAVREQRQLRRRRARQQQTPGIDNLNAVSIYDILEPSTSDRGAPLRRTISIQDLDDLEEVTDAEREENSLASGIPVPGSMITPEEPTIARRQGSPTPETSQTFSRALSISAIEETMIEMAESTHSGSSANTHLGKHPRDSDDDDDEEGQKRIQKKGRITEG